jgi:Fe-S cluster assembly ATP-binding protein
MSQSDSNPPLLQIEDLVVAIDDKQIIKGLDLTVRRGERHALMGRNGSGKSTLSHAIMGHPHYEVLGGRILFKGEDITAMSTDERARLGVFLGFQYPMTITGVTVANFLRQATRSIHGESVSAGEFRKKVKQTMADLGVNPDFAKRYLNEGFSGGEKKRLEILQMSILEPTLAVLDETDSGLDIDALRVVADGINRNHAEDRATLLITHYQRILRYVEPDYVHVMIDGRIVRSGGSELAHELEERGYDWLEQASLEEAS